MRIGSEDNSFMKFWTWKRENLPTLSHAFRTAIAATISILLGRLVGLPEAYWAVIATVVVMQSPVGDTVPLAIERIVASALGASIGAIESTYFGANLFVFALATLLLGLLSFVLRLEKVGYSYSCITLAIIVMIPRAETPWIAAVHRFAEVSLGILVAIAVVSVWRAERRLVGDTIGE
jgi:Predicted membrane protein